MSEVNWREEAVYLKIWSDSGWRNGLWSRVRCSLTWTLSKMSEWTEEKLWIWRSGVILDEGMVSDLVSGVLWPEPCRRWVRWTEEKKLWIWRSGVILDEGMVSDLVSGVLWPEPCRRWVRWTEEEKLWIWRSGVILDEGMVSDLVSGVLWPEPCRRWVSELKRRSCESEDLEWFWMKEWSLILCQVFSDLIPVEHEWVNWREEAVNLKIWSDSGWRNGLWSRVRCSLTWTL